MSALDAPADPGWERFRSYLLLLARLGIDPRLLGKLGASDLVQQTLLEAHRGFAKFQGNTEGEWLAWLKQILAHNAQDFVRRYRTDKRHAGREVALQVPADGTSGSFFRDPPDGGESPSQMLAQQEREIELADAIAQLSPDHQEVIMLRNLQRLPFDEVAQRMGRSRPAVQMLWMRALKRMQQLLEERD